MSDIKYLLFLCEVFALVVGSYNFRIIKQKFLFLYFYVLLGVSTDFLNLLLMKLGTQNNLWTSHIYFPLEFVVMALFYMPLLVPVIKRRWMILIISVFVLYSILNAAFIQSITEYSQIRVFSSIILVLFSFIYFYIVFNEAKSFKLSTDSLIWVNSIVLVFYSTVFFFSVMANLILGLPHKTALFIAVINTFVIAFFYIIVAFIFRAEGRQQIKRKRISLE